MAGVFAVTAAAVPFLGEEFLPELQGVRLPDALGREAGHVARRRCSASRCARARNCAPIPGVRNFGAHIGRAEVADEVVGPNFTELWISIDPTVDYDATRGADPGGRRRLSRASTATC